MRLIDADALKEKAIYMYGFGQNKYVPMKAIDNAPAIKAVEVVRCGECKRAKAYKAWDGHAGFKCELLWVDIGVNDFCSYGERR